MFFKKKQPIVENKVEEKPVEQPKRASYLDFYKKIHDKVKKEPTEADRKALLKELFPRNINDVQVINNKTGAKVAMDEMYKPATYQEDLPMFMMPFFNHSFIGWQACALLTQIGRAHV